MESQDYSPPPPLPLPLPHMDSSRPYLGFPLGTALLLIVIFSLSGIFSCFYHWDKLRSIRQNQIDDPISDIEASSTPPKSKKTQTHDAQQNKSQSLTVLMPGDRVPKFMALPCPCQPLRPEKVVHVKVHKPPRMAVPLY